MNRKTKFIIFGILIVIAIVCVLFCIMTPYMRVRFITGCSNFFHDNETIKINYDVNDIESIEIYGVAEAVGYDNYEEPDVYRYTDKNKIKKIVSLLTETPVVQSSRNELPNKSAESFIVVYGKNHIELDYFSIYGAEWVWHSKDDRFYRYKISVSNWGVLDYR